MEAWTNSSTGAVESLPEGAPSADPAGAEVTPAPHPATLDASNVATPPPEAAVPTPLPTMVSGEIGHAPVPVTTAGAAAVTPPPAAEPAPSVVIATAAPAVHAPAPTRQPAHAGDDPGFSDQIINNWMRQGDRLADPRPIQDLDLTDLAEPTDPVAHELLDSQKQRLRPMARSSRVGRWLSVGALGVAMSFGLYWAAQEPRPGAGFVAAAPVPARVIEAAPVAEPPAPTPVAPAPQVATAETTPAATDAAHGRHKHRRNAGAGRTHRRHAH